MPIPLLLLKVKTLGKPLLYGLGIKGGIDIIKDVTPDKIITPQPYRIRWTWITLFPILLVIILIFLIIRRKF